MDKIIDKFAETIPSTQARIALEILNEHRESGAIGNVEEYNKALQDLLSGASRQNPVPLLHIIPAGAFKYASSDDFNYVFKTLDGDLQAIFTELTSLFQFIQAHHEIYQGEILGKLKSAVDGLEEDIEHAFTSNGGTTKISSTFLQGDAWQGTRPIGQGKIAGLMAMDFNDVKPKDSPGTTPKPVPLTPCSLDTVDGSITLPIAKEVKESFKKAEVLDKLAPSHVIETRTHELAVAYAFSAGDLLIIYLEDPDIVKVQRVIFSNTNFFRRQTYEVPTERGEYLVLYNQGDAETFTQETGFAAAGGCVVVLAPIDSSQLGPEGLGTVSYGVWVLGYTSTPTEFDIEPPENDISKLIDGRDDTFWIHHLLFEDKLSDGARSKIRLTYDGVRAINYLELTPITSYPFDIMAIHYINENWVETSLNIYVEKFEKKIKIAFEEIKARGFIFYFKINSFEYATYQLTGDNNLDYAARGYKDLEAGDLYPHLEELGIKYEEQLIGYAPRQKQVISYHQYTMGLAEARSGLLKYEPAGVFLSSAVKVKNPGMTALEAVEFGNPLDPQVDSIVQSPKLRGSFEYYVVKRDYLENTGQLVSELTIPINPSDTGYVTERLYPVNGKVMYTSFRAHGIEQTGTLPGSILGLDSEEKVNAICDLKLYRNGVELERGLYADNYHAPSGDYYIENQSQETRDDPFSKIILNRRDADGNPQFITGSEKSPAETDAIVYEAIYKPWYTVIVEERGQNLPVASLTSIYSAAGETRAINIADHSVYFAGADNDNPILSEIQLKIVIRNNSYDGENGTNLLRPDLTPRVRSFKLGIGSVEPTKRFIGL